RQQHSREHCRAPRRRHSRPSDAKRLRFTVRRAQSRHGNAGGRTMSMNISQFFVTKRPIAWTAMMSVLVWGIYAYLMMPQRQDPIIPVVTGVILTPYPGAEAEKVEQEVTRKIERKVAENPAVEHVKSISRPGISIVYVELFESERQ